jgi:hypothetical protein
MGPAPDLISRISITTYFYIYLAGDQIWTMSLGGVRSRELPYSATTLLDRVRSRELPYSATTPPGGVRS